MPKLSIDIYQFQLYQFLGKTSMIVYDYSAILIVFFHEILF